MDAAEYDAWYQTPRGSWIGDAELRLLTESLRLEKGETLLDVGCGTGYFTRRLAGQNGGFAVGLDPNPVWLQFAYAHAVAGTAFVAGDGTTLPFPNRSFDRSVSVTALCFVGDQASFLSEMIRVTRKRFALGLLNRASLLYLQKGRHGGSGAYRGAAWHTAEEIRARLDGLPVTNVTIRSGVFLPSGGRLGRCAEHLLPGCLPCGSFLAVAGDCL